MDAIANTVSAMSTIDTLYKQSLRTREILTRATLDGLDWKAGLLNASELALPSAHFYLWDHETNWAWGGAVPVATFKKVASSSRKYGPAEQQAIVVGLEQAILRAGRAGAVAGEQHNASAEASRLALDWETELSILTCEYASGTTTLRLFYEQKTSYENMHFVILRYPAQSRIRPFIGSQDYSTLIPAQELAEMVRIVIEMDQERHPDWF